MLSGVIVSVRGRFRGTGGACLVWSAGSGDRGRGRKAAWWCGRPVGAVSRWRRTLPGLGSLPLSKSARPRSTVDSEIPVARTTAAIPPRPAARASAAAHNRRPRSSNTP